MLLGVLVVTVNDVVAFFYFVYKFERFAGGRLSVIIEADDVIACGLSVASHEGRVLPEIFGEADSLDARISCG